MDKMGILTEPFGVVKANSDVLKYGGIMLLGVRTNIENATWDVVISARANVSEVDYIRTRSFLESIENSFVMPLYGNFDKIRVAHTDHPYVNRFATLSQRQQDESVAVDVYDFTRACAPKAKQYEIVPVSVNVADAREFARTHFSGTTR